MRPRGAGAAPGRHPERSGAVPAIGLPGCQVGGRAGRDRPPVFRAQTLLPLKFRQFSPLVAVCLFALLCLLQSSRVSPFFPPFFSFTALLLLFVPLLLPLPR